MVFVMFSLFKSFYCCDPPRKAHMKASSTHLSPLTHLPAALAPILTGTGQVCRDYERVAEKRYWLSLRPTTVQAAASSSAKFVPT